MGRVGELAHRYNISVLVHGSMCLIPAQEAERFLAACSAEDQFILGIEAFYLRDDKVIPETNAIADFSELLSAARAVGAYRSLEEARGFLAQFVGRDLFFDFTLEGDDS